MIVKGKDVIGLNVVTIDDGTKIQTVDDIAYDPTNHQIVALLVDSGGLFSSAKAILIDDVHNIGEDAVIVPTSSVIRPLKELAEGVRSISESNKHLVTTNVLTIDGKQLGRVTDIFFDSANGVVESMEVSQGGLKTMTEGKKSIKPADIVTIGADATIVSTYTEQKLEAQGEENGLKGALNDAKEKIEEASENVKKTAKDVSEKVSEKSKEIARDTRDKAEDVRDAASKKIDEMRDRADDTIADMRRNGRQMSEDVKDRTDEAIEKTQKIVDNTVETAKDKGEELHGKATQAWNSRTDSADTAHHSSGEVVKKTAQHYEDNETVIDEKRTVVKK